MATINLGSIKFKWQGAYAGGTAYTVDDVVSYQGSSYICIQASTGNLPTNATYWEQMSSAGTNGTNGTDLTTTLTTQGDLVYYNGSALARLGAGTSGQVLQTNGTGANPSWGSVSSDFVKLVEYNITSNVNEVILDNYFSSTYRTYKIFADNIVHSVTNNNVRFNMRSGGASGTDYTGQYFNVRTGANTGGASVNSTQTYAWAQSDGYVDIQDYDNVDGQGGSFEMTLFNPNIANKTHIRTNSLASFSNLSNFTVHDTAVLVNINTQFTGIKFKIQTSSNNFTNGHFRLYGIK
jgi:hypothetical protein